MVGTDGFEEDPHVTDGAKAGLTDDQFLGGKLNILQPEKGYRAGTDAVLLAASVPATAGEAVFEAGLGTGVAALCLAKRVPGVVVTGIEAASRHVMIAEENARRNALQDAVHILKGDLLDSMRHGQVDWPGPATFSHAFANPPFFEEGSVQKPADSLRAQAHLLKPGELEAWVRVMASLLKPRGTLTLIHPASSLYALLQAMAPRLGGLTVFPLFSRPGEDASRIIVRGVKGSKAPLRLCAGLALHGAESGAFVAAADDVLRNGRALELGR